MVASLNESVPPGEDMTESRQRVRAYVDRALEFLAHLSFGQYDVELDSSADDEAFAELFAGLALLVDDLREARREADDLSRVLEQQVTERTGELARAVAALREDIGKREAAEAALRASEALYRSLVETSPDAIALARPDGRLQTINSAFTQTFRLAGRESAIGSMLVDFVTPSERERARECWHTLERSGHERTAEIHFERADGSLFLGEVRWTPVAGDADLSGGVLMVIRDVTHRRRQEDELLRVHKLESLGTLAGGIAHDFNNTLAAITGNLFLAARRVGHDAQVHALLMNAADAACRATALTNQLLTFSKGGAPVKECLDVRSLVRRAVEFCMAGSSVSWCLDFEEDLSPVEVDAGQIEQVLGNLVINAKQAMGEGGRIEVSATNELGTDPEVATGESRSYVCISVRDTGTGILPEHRDRIFDPYFTTKECGSGLGLATAFSVVKGHGGFITVETEPGEGSVFGLHLPASGRSPTVPAARRSRSAGRVGRILVMDDDPAVRAMTQRLLEGAGHETVGAASGREALERYLEARKNGQVFSAVIMDLTVPGGDGGKETIVGLLEVDPSVQAIVMSGYSDDPVLANHREYGFVGMLSKPFRVEALLDVVDDVLAAAERGQQS